MSKLRVCKWTFVFCLGALFVYVAVLAYRSAYGGPWWTGELNVAALVLGALAADISFRCWQAEDEKATTWQREPTQQVPVVAPSVLRFRTEYRPVPVVPPMRRPGEQINTAFPMGPADVKGMLSNQLDRGELRPRWADLPAEDTGDVSKGDTD